MWSNGEIKSMQEAASARQTAREKAKQGFMLNNALKQDAAKQAGEVYQKQMDIDAAKDKIASEAGYNRSVTKDIEAATELKKLETSAAAKLAPSAIASGIANNKSDAFTSALSLAKNKRNAIGERFVVNSATNQVGLNDSEATKHVNDMDKQNEFEIASSKRKSGIGVTARPRRAYKAPFTGGIFD
jgi:hypothetical protein